MPAASRTASSARRAASSSADGVPDEHLAGGRERDAAGAALQHARAERRLQAADVLGDGGLREVERHGGVGERAAHRDLAESGEELEVEHHGPLCHMHATHHWT